MPFKDLVLAAFCFEKNAADGEVAAFMTMLVACPAAVGEQGHHLADQLFITWRCVDHVETPLVPEALNGELLRLCRRPFVAPQEVLHAPMDRQAFGPLQVLTADAFAASIIEQHAARPAGSHFIAWQNSSIGFLNKMSW